MQKTLIVTPLLIAILSSACWSERHPCELWDGKLKRGREPGLAVMQLGVLGCVQSRGLLLEHLDDPGLGADVLAALVALGRSTESEAAVRRALDDQETVAVAAKQVVEWQLGSAEPELRAALANDKLLSHRAELVAAALAIAPPDQWVDALVAEATETGLPAERVERALAALAKVAWDKVEPAVRASVVERVAARLMTEGVPEAHAAVLWTTLAQASPSPAPALVDVVAGARKGQRDALLVLAALEHPEVAALTRELRTRADVDATTRALALALGGADAAELAGAIAAAPGDADVLLGLALAAGPGAADALAVRREAAKGAERAAVVRAQAATLAADTLAPWLAALGREASQLLRGLPEEPAVAGVVQAIRRCGTDAGCHARWLGEVAPQLATLDAERVAAAGAVTAARADADAKTRDDTLRAAELAKATGADVAAAHAELDAIRERTAKAYAAVTTLEHAVDASRRSEYEALLALHRAAGAPDAPQVARAVLERCAGAACAGLRAAALALVLAAEEPQGAARAALVLQAR